MATNSVSETNDDKENPEETKELEDILTTSHPDSPGHNNESGEVAVHDRLQQRLERFGKVSPEAKKISRALRFGTHHESLDDAAKKRRLDRFGVGSNNPEDDQEKKKVRSERFQTNNPAPVVDEETKKKRIDRFGLVTPTQGSKKRGDKSTENTPAITDAIKKRVERFGDVSDAAKAQASNDQKAKRAERFKPNTSV